LSAFVFSFSSHALIKEFLFSVSTLARARSADHVSGFNRHSCTLVLDDKKKLFNYYLCHWSPLASQRQASLEQVHLQLLERQKNREFMPAFV